MLFTREEMVKWKKGFSIAPLQKPPFEKS